MKAKLTLCTALLLICGPLLAASSSAAAPITKPTSGASCPAKYSNKGKVCVPDKGAKPGFAKEKNSDSCPSGYSSAGWYCMKR